MISQPSDISFSTAELMLSEAMSHHDSTIDALDKAQSTIKFLLRGLRERDQAIRRLIEENEKLRAARGGN